MRHLFSLLVPFVLGGCLVTSLAAQQPKVKQPQPADVGVINDLDVTVTDVTEEKLNNPPKREIKIERPEKTYKSKLFKSDPKLFEQKVVAQFELEVPSTGNQYAHAVDNDSATAPLAHLAQRNLLFPVQSNFSQAPGQKQNLDSFAQMIKALPSDDIPAKREREFLTIPESKEWMLTYYYRDSGGDAAKKNAWVFMILATTPEEAELRSKAVIYALDQGACRPIRLALLKKREPLCVQLREQRKAGEAVSNSVNNTQEILKGLADFTPDMLSNLRVQQLQLEVDLAGVKARVAACERLLAQAALKPERRTQIEDVKVAAEIEFSGFEARLMKSNEFITKVKTKVELLDRLSIAETEQTRIRAKIRTLDREIRFIDGAISAYAPLPLVDNKITIQPLEWTE